MSTASIIVDLYKSRCGACKIALPDDLAKRCGICGAVFDRVVSNHVGLAKNLEQRRREANPPSFRAVSEQVLLEMISQLGNEDRWAGMKKSVDCLLQDAPVVNDNLTGETVQAALAVEEAALRDLRG